MLPPLENTKLKRTAPWETLDGPLIGYGLKGSDDELSHVRLARCFNDPQDALSTLPSERPGLVAALVELELRRAKALLVPSAVQLGDRLGWASVAELVERQGAALITLAGDAPDGSAEVDATVDQAKSALADHHHLARAVEIRAGHERRLRSGKRISRHPPYGYQVHEDGETLIAVPEELAIIERMKALRMEGLSYQKVAAALDAEGHPTRTGRPWGRTTARQILMREMGESER